MQCGTCNRARKGRKVWHTVLVIGAAVLALADRKDLGFYTGKLRHEIGIPYKKTTST